MKIDYLDKHPSVKEFELLYKSTGWDSVIQICEESLRKTIENTWYWVSAMHNDKTVGVGRLISDGSLYAFVCDMIVFPEYQGHGVGKQILNHLKEKCYKEKIQKVWLISAPGKSGFYEKNGFIIRPKDAPGMQLK